MHLREWRKARDLTAAMLAEQLGMTQPTLTRIERGETWPNPETIEKIFDVTGGEVTVADLSDVWKQTKGGNPPPHGNCSVSA